MTTSACFASSLWIDTNANGAINVGTDTPVASGVTTYGSSLTAGACFTLLSSITAPLGAASGVLNVTTVTATHASAGTPSATDTTTVVSGDLQISKRHRTVNCTAGGTGTGVAPQTTLTNQNIGTALVPGTSCVQYEVTATGSKLWRWKYRHAGKEKRLALGVYSSPALKAGAAGTVSLATARADRDAACGHG